MIIDLKDLRPIAVSAAKHPTFMALGFCSACLLALAASIFWPRVYTSDAAIFVEQKNILGPLMEGAAVQTGVNEQSRLAGDILSSRRIISKVLEAQGIKPEDRSAVEFEQAMDNIRDRIQVSVESPNLISIEYSDKDAQRAYLTTKILSESFMAESAESKMEESNSAYQFIDNQVKEYENKLRVSEEKLKNFNSENQAVAPGAEGQIRSRITSLEEQISDIEQNLREARIREAGLRDQLSGENKTAEKVAVTNSLQVQIDTLQEELNSLRLNYHDEYPTIVHVKEQIASLKAQMKAEYGDQPRLPTEVSVVDSTGTTTALLQQNYYETKLQIATLTSRLEDKLSVLATEQTRMRNIPAIELQLKEINREYNVNQTIYSDLLRRREIARVSMNVDREQQGLTLRVQEAAYLPLTPGGPRSYQILAAGLLFGLFAPLGLIFLYHRVDGKIRHADHLAEEFGVPVISTVPQMLSTKEARRTTANIVLHSTIMILTLIGVVTVAVLNSMGVISL